MIFSAIVGGILAIKDWIMPQGLEWLILLSLGVFGYFGPLFMTKAVQSTQINLIAPLKYIEVIFTMIFGILYFKESYTIMSIFAIILILTGLCFNTILKRNPRNT
jgi:drug/metabolite transporter (DMT)-like permease